MEAPHCAPSPAMGSLAGRRPPHFVGRSTTRNAETPSLTQRACEHPGVLLRGGPGVGIIAFGLWVYCLLDVIMTDDHRVRNLSKAVWVAVVLLTFEVGAVAWLVAGRPRPGSRDLPYKGNAGRAARQYPEYDRPGRFVATNPDDDEAFLRQVRERAEQQTRAARKPARPAKPARRERARAVTPSDGKGMTWAARALSPAASPPDAGARPPPSVLSEADAELRAPLSRVDGGLVVAAGGRSVLGETPRCTVPNRCWPSRQSGPTSGRRGRTGSPGRRTPPPHRA